MRPRMHTRLLRSSAASRDSGRGTTMVTGVDVKQLFVIRNQHQHYLGRHHEWVDGSNPAAVLRTPHRDVAANELFEANLKDIALRGEILACELDERGLPRIEVLNPIPEPLPETATSDAPAA